MHKKLNPKLASFKENTHRNSFKKKLHLKQQDSCCQTEKTTVHMLHRILADEQFANRSAMGNTYEKVHITITQTYKQLTEQHVTLYTLLCLVLQQT